MAQSVDASVIGPFGDCRSLRFSLSFHGLLGRRSGNVSNLAVRFIVFEQVTQPGNHSLLFVHVMFACDRNISVTESAAGSVDSLARTDLASELLA